mmetsp:Transcript_7518/g.16593  ORF Transcript_7518/g.16593 Transcript_7518/m.16593 type:complete len:200 (-) Transcript_7518:88-687(-)
MAIRRLHVAQAEARVGGVLDRAVEAPAVALDTVNVHDAARAVDEDLAPHARMLGLLADEVGDLRVLGERCLREEDLEGHGEGQVGAADRLEDRRQPDLLRGVEFVGVVGAEVVEGGELGVLVAPVGNVVVSADEAVALARDGLLSQAGLHGDVAEDVDDVLEARDLARQRLRVRRLERQLHHLHVHLHHQLRRGAHFGD